MQRPLYHPFPTERKEIRLHTLANLFRLVVDVFGRPNAKSRLEKLEGKEIQADIPALGGSLVFKPYAGRIHARVGISDEPVGTITLAVPFEEVLDVLAEIICLPNTKRGVLTVFTQYILKKKVKVQWRPKSLLAILKIFRCFMLGTHPMYQKYGLPDFIKKKGSHT